jgi:hypothetical protein
VGRPTRHASIWERPRLAPTQLAAVTTIEPPPVAADGSVELRYRRVQRFQLIQHLGSGTMGSVYRAHDPQLDRDVAIKLLAASAPLAELSPTDTIDLRSSSPASPDDLLREARIMARLSHPNLLPVYEVGIADGAVFLVTEYVDGQNLASWLTAPRSTAAIVQLFSQVARGLAAAHASGVVHRDVKPANILIGRDGRVRVADFGLSRLSHRPTGMVRIADPGGTPRYMAPELWRGEPASPASDVFAMCTALFDALAGVDVATPDRPDTERISLRLREQLVRGLSEVPAKRPPLADLIAVLEGRSRHWRRWPLAVAAGAVGAGVFGLLGALSSPGRSEPACALDASRFAGRWDAAQRTAALAVAPADRARVFVAAVDRQRRAIEVGLTAACSAVRAGDITLVQHHSREACLDRRGFELAGTVDLMIGKAADPAAAQRALAVLASPAECAEIAAPRGQVAAPTIEALWRRYAHSAIHAVPDGARDHVTELTAIEREATAAGETELAARAALWLSREHRFLDQVDLADQTAQRAYRAALDSHATIVGVRALVLRAWIALHRGDPTTSLSFAKLGQDLAAGSLIATPPVHAQVEDVLGSAALQRADPEVAIEHLQRGLALLHGPRDATAGEPNSDDELDVRRHLMSALSGSTHRAAELLALARDTVEFVRSRFGDRGIQYSAALDKLAAAVGESGDPLAAIQYRRQALELALQILPAGSSQAALLRLGLSIDLDRAGQLEASRKELVILTELTQANPMIHVLRPKVLGFLSQTQFELGHVRAGLELGAQALEDASSQFGNDHPTTRWIRWSLAESELEVRQLDAAARDIAALDASLTAHPEENQLSILRGTLGAELAISRGHARDGEAAALAAAGALPPSEGDPQRELDRASIQLRLGYARLAQRRYADARAAFTDAADAAHNGNARDDVVGAIEAQLAVAEAKLGQRALARRHARHATALLARYPGQLHARRAASSVLARR